MAHILLVPLAMLAGHVESRALRASSPAEWWKQNRDSVLGAAAGPTTPAELLDRRPDLRVHYPEALARAIESDASRLDLADETREDLLARLGELGGRMRGSPGVLATVSAERFLRETHEAAARGLKGPEARGFADFAADERTGEAVVADLRRRDRASVTAESAAVDLVLLLEFLDPANRAFIRNGYSTTEVNPQPVLYEHLKWDSKSVDRMRSEVRDILVEIGAPVRAVAERAAKDHETYARRDGKSVVMPRESLAVERSWSTKPTEFETRVSPAFVQDLEWVLDRIGEPEPATVAKEKPADGTTVARPTRTEEEEEKPRGAFGGVRVGKRRP